jgi:hypothetical protein
VLREYGERGKMRWRDCLDSHRTNCPRVRRDCSVQGTGEQREWLQNGIVWEPHVQQEEAVDEEMRVCCRGHSPRGENQEMRTSYSCCVMGGYVGRGWRIGGIVSRRGW